MSKILTLADLHAEQCLTAGLLLEEGHWKKELQAEVERMEAAHQQELAQVKADLKSCQAKNRELLDEVAEAEETMFRIEPKIDAPITERDALKAEIAALREDAARWKWIQENIYSYPYDDHGCGPEFDLSNEAIDAARSKQ